MLIYLAIKIPHLQIAHEGGNLEVGNIKIHPLIRREKIGPEKSATQCLFDRGGKGGVKSYLGNAHTRITFQKWGSLILEVTVCQT